MAPDQRTWISQTLALRGLTVLAPEQAVAVTTTQRGLLMLEHASASDLCACHPHLITVDISGDGAGHAYSAMKPCNPLVQAESGFEGVTFDGTDTYRPAPSSRA
ncbi:hypothetical protein [Methylobacterium phyllostachyos]